MRTLSAIVLFTIHGAALALCARLLGDRGPQYDGRLTLNPFAHVDVFGLVGAVTVRFGWIRPMPIDAKELRFGRLGLVLCGAIALVATLLFARIALWFLPVAVTWAPAQASLAIVGGFGVFSDMAVWFFVFNLLPFPPLTGGLVLAAVAPGLHKLAMEHIVWISVALVVLLVLTLGGRLHTALHPLARLIAP